MRREEKRDYISNRIRIQREEGRQRGEEKNKHTALLVEEGRAFAASHN